jgi:hemolysin III
VRVYSAAHVPYPDRVSAEIPVSPRELPSPVLRGRLHEVAFFVSIPAGLVLILLAPGPKAVIGAAVYWLALMAQFGVSAAYHVGVWGERAHARMRTLDHATIFVLIAGTYTPFCLMVLQGVQGIVVLSIVWVGAAIGVATKVYRTDLHVLSGFLYLGLGWVAVIVFPALVRDLSTTQLALMILGGAFYTGGALVLALHRPNPWPRMFGYHEVWHAATIAAAVYLYTAILLVFLSS